MEKFTPKEEMQTVSKGTSNPSSYFPNSNYGENSSSSNYNNSGSYNPSSNFGGNSFGGRGNNSSSSPIKAKNEGFKKINNDFDFDSLVDEPPSEGKNQYANDLDFESNKMSQKPLKPNINNGNRMRSARKFLEENNDMDFGINKSKSVMPEINQGSNSGASNYHFGVNSEFQGFTGGVYQPQGFNHRIGGSEFDFGRRGQNNSNNDMMIGDNNYGARNDNKGINSGSTGLFGTSSRRRK